MNCAPLIGIPARLNSTRLPGKALLEINGTPLICHVVQRAQALSLPTPPVVFTDSVEIQEAVTQRGGVVSLDDTSCESGTERVARGAIRCLKQPDARLEGWDQAWVVNVQGDEPLLPLSSLTQLVSVLGRWEQKGVHVVTLGCHLQEEERAQVNPHLVKLCVREDMRALYFSRAEIGAGRALRHIGVYAFHVSVINVLLKDRTALSIAEDLEQLSWMERGLEIGVELVDAHPKGVDTLEDLQRVRRVLA